MDDALRQTGERLGEAIASGRYADADQMLGDYCRQVARIKDADAARQAGELLEWARRTVLAQRANLATRLARLRSLPRAYRGAAATAAHTWELEG